MIVDEETVFCIYFIKYITCMYKSVNCFSFVLCFIFYYYFKKVALQLDSASLARISKYKQVREDDEDPYLAEEAEDLKQYGVSVDEIEFERYSDLQTSQSHQERGLFFFSFFYFFFTI